MYKSNQRDLRLQELNILLLARVYPESIVDSAIIKARQIPRRIALLKVRKKTKKKDPYLLQNITKDFPLSSEYTVEALEING